MLIVNPYIRKFYNRDYIFHVSSGSWLEFTQLLRQLKVTNDDFCIHTKLDKSQEGSKVYLAYEGKIKGYLLITEIKHGDKNDVLINTSPYVYTCPPLPVTLSGNSFRYFYNIPNFN